MGITIINPAEEYVLPIAGESTLGGVKVGDNLDMTEAGVLSVPDSAFEAPGAVTSHVGESDPHTGYVLESAIDTDVTMADPSNSLVPSQAAVKSYVDTLVGALSGGVTFQGVIDASANPNYPGADVGHIWIVSVAGKVGGASGAAVDLNDMLICVHETDAGTQAAVGANWCIIQGNLTGVVIGPTSATDGAIAQFDGVTGKLLKAALYLVTTVGAEGADTNLPSEQAVREAIAAITAAAVGALATGDATSTPTASKIPIAGTDKTVDTWISRTVSFQWLAPDGALATGDGKAVWTVPAEYTGFELVGVFGSLATVSSSGAPSFMLRRNRAGTDADMLSTALTIDANERDSSTAATAAVIGTNKALQTGDQVWIDVDAAGTGAKGPEVQALIRKAAA